MSKPAAPLRMPPGAKRTPLADSHSTALGRSSIHSPTWLSGVAVNGGLLLRVDWLHQVDFHLERPLAHGADVFIYVFAFGLKSPRDFQSQFVHPQGLEFFLGRTANGDLLDTEDFERTGHVFLQKRG